MALGFKRIEIRDKSDSRNFHTEDQVVITEPESREQENEAEVEEEPVYGYLYVKGSGRWSSYPTINYEGRCKILREGLSFASSKFY